MALDSRNKRASAMAIGLPFLIVGTLPAPDGSVDLDDRPQTVQMAIWPPAASPPDPPDVGGVDTTTMHPVFLPRRRR